MAKLKQPAAAEYLGITERQLRRMAQHREIPFHYVGRFKIFDTDDLDTYLAENRIEAGG